ncbi:MAG: murein biosynthesis integral membrane protein MurJ [Candidatus Cloacimonetes bacterium]|nr:murein biosynthesis integral membrane protein MurJ [Candidatus Cloacimonadota bacterium]MCF7814980.1 murein biosynthesis integral membrane protein MurJ [Candidatus Cloacimonadota bacterium]MCF7869328.1 murein biosynthesis integral membrane protein MurJ [Candidatus Cloacimonadota bacterium]MCF7884299.1 murein biosynthesis integral membrane protein MurJ [Candidatus Cloacimonadota bacterium]
MSNRKLAKNAGSMSLAVFISRILGLIRDIMMTGFFGTSAVADAFRVAFQIPNFLRRLFGEGALSAAFVPIYTEMGVNKSREFQIKFALNVLSLLTAFLVILCIMGILLAPILVKVIAPGLDAETQQLTVKLTRILFPYLFLIGLSSTLISILNSHDIFFIPGLSSAFLNLGMIGCLGFFVLINDTSTMQEKVFVWSFGVLIGGILQTIINFPLLKKLGYSLKLNLRRQNEALKDVWQRLIPGAIGIAVRQINLIADMILASLLVTGSIAALGYGNRLMQLPMGIFGIAAGVAVLPLFSRYVAKQDWQGLYDSLKFSVVSLSFIMLPVTAIIAGLGKDLIRLLFMRGQFNLHSLEMTYSALLFYSLGIFFYSMNRLIIPVFYANKDTKTPVKVSAVIVLINIILNIIFMQFLEHAGLALATSVSAAVQFIMLKDLMRKKIGLIHFPKVGKEIWKLFFISLIIYAVLFVANYFLIASNVLELIVKLILLSIISLVIMLVGSDLLNVRYSKQIKARIKRKLLKK